MISFENVTKHYGAFEVLKSITTTVKAGEVVCVVGPSGSGKSTLLRTINGLESISSGKITVDGLPLDGNAKVREQVRRQVGMVFQSFNLFPHLTVRRNLTLAPRRVGKLSHQEANTTAERLLARVGIIEQIDKYPAQLSGGQQQRVAIARALAMEPRVLLFDEPTSALDPEMVKEVLDVMRELAHTGITMVVVTHEMKFARDVADRIVFMDAGRILIDSAPTDFFSKELDPRLTKFLSHVV